MNKLLDFQFNRVGKINKVVLILNIIFHTINLVAICTAQGSIDHTFNKNDLGYGIGDGASDVVYTSLLQNDGKIIIGGLFTSYNATTRNRIARLKPTGVLDESFQPGAGTDGPIYCSNLQADEKIIIAGMFSKYNETKRINIARINPDGSLDSNFNPGLGPDNLIQSAAIQSDGKIIIAGEFTRFNGTTINRIARLDTSGNLDTSFNSGSGANGPIFITILQPDGKIIIGGQFTSYNGIDRMHIARLNSDGAIDTTFNPGKGTENAIMTIALQTDGKILIGGKFKDYNGTGRNRIARLNTDGTLDANFDPGSGTNATVNTISLQIDGKIIIGGEFTSFNGTERKGLARLNKDGSVDHILYPEFKNVLTLLTQPDGKYILGGWNYHNDWKFKNRIVRLNTDGSHDSQFNQKTGADDIIRSIAIQPDGKIIIGGLFTAYNGQGKNHIARLNPDGDIDTSFSSLAGVNNFVYTTVLQPDGKIIIGGAFNFYNEIRKNYIARLNQNGTLDTTFIKEFGANNNIFTIALQPDGKIIIGGWATLFNGNEIMRITRLNSVGTIDTTFKSGSGANDLVHNSLVQPDGKIIIGGRFTSYNGVSINRIARLNNDGTIDPSFNPGSGFNKDVYTISLQPDGKIIIGGNFTNFNGAGINRIARLNADGTYDTSFKPGIGADSTVWTSNLQPDGKIIIGGLFKSYNGTERMYIMRLNSDGTIDASFNSITGANDLVYTSAIQPDGKIIIGGKFTAYNGTGRNRLARLLNCSLGYGYDVITACKMHTWIDDKTYTSSSMTATFNIIEGSYNGCDSIITLHLTIDTIDTTIMLSGNTLTANATGAIYQWLDCDNNYSIIRDEINQSFTSAQPGNYAVAIKQKNCTDTSSCHRIIATDTDEIKPDQKFSIHPNPFSTQTTIGLISSLNNATITVFNSFGQSVMQLNKINGKSISLSRAFLKSGMYYLQLKQDNKFIGVKKILITD